MPTLWKLALLPVLTFSTLPLIAQRVQNSSAPKYDMQAETKMKGTIEEVKIPPKGREKEIVHLLVKTTADTTDVYLCPKSFLEMLGMNFSKGDELGFTGSRVKQGELEFILVREIVKGTDTFVLRDGKGNPVW
ncbi:MAG TPA: hypothetical protein VHR84_17465 [Terriglobales bacterium]|jgi:hypothetical protein|nr:hypothetical protein [Terriglobales bacterium]